MDPVGAASAANKKPDRKNALYFAAEAAPTKQKKEMPKGISFFYPTTHNCSAVPFTQRA
jgi:hypothetical protein